VYSAFSKFPCVGEHDVDSFHLHNCVEVKVDRHILHTVKVRKANWIGRILSRNCLLKHVTEVNIEGRIRSDGETR